MFIDLTNPDILHSFIIIMGAITAVMFVGGALLSIFGKSDNIGDELMKMSLIPFLLFALLLIVAI